MQSSKNNVHIIRTGICIQSIPNKIRIKIQLHQRNPRKSSLEPRLPQNGEL